MNTTAVIEYQETQLEWEQLSSYLAHGLTISTLAMYRRDMKAYLDYASRNDLPTDAPRTVEMWRDDMVLNSTKSPNTINRMLSSIRRFMREARKQGWISVEAAYDFEHLDGVSLTLLKERMKHTRSIPITRAQMQMLCSLPDQTTLLGLRDRALLLTLATSGVRASELASLRVDRIFHKEGQPGAGTGYIIQIMGKKDIEYRDCNLSPDAYAAIQTWLSVRGVPCPYVFSGFVGFGITPAPTKLSAKAVWDVTKAYAKQIGLEYISPHSFRRFVGTQIAAIDIRIAQVTLGHKDISTTAKHYVLDSLTVGVTDNLI